MIMGAKTSEQATEGCSHDEESSGSGEFTDLEDTKPMQETSRAASYEDVADIDRQVVLALAEEVMVPEYDTRLNHIFFTPKPLCDKDRVREEDLRLNFFSAYRAFFDNRLDLVDTLRDIADKAVKVRRDCNISHIVSGSVGIAGGASAIVGSIVFPPLLIGGLIAAGVAAASNLGTTITQFVLFRELVQASVQKSNYDDDLMRSLEEAYRTLILSNLFIVEERTPTGEINQGFSLTKLQAGLDGASALATGVRSVGVGMVEVGSGLLRGVAQGAMGVGVVIDGVTIVISAADLAKGSNTKLSDALRKLADEKQEELEALKKKVDSTGLFHIGKKDLDTDEARFVLRRNVMASVL